MWTRAAHGSSAEAGVVDLDGRDPQSMAELALVA